MKADHHKQVCKQQHKLPLLLAVTVATLLLFACSACNGFFVDPKLTSVAVTPTGVTLIVNNTTQYQAIGTYDDGSTKTLTAVWLSSSTATATVSNTGLAKGIAAGTATITATAGGVSGTTTLTVQTAPLQSITIAPANPSISLTKGSITQQFTATGRNTDGTTADLTSSATWTSTAPAIATINTTGGATAVAVGTTTIQAAVGSIVGSTSMIVVQ